jgi:hypothetical protein
MNLNMYFRRLYGGNEYIHYHNHYQYCVHYYLFIIYLFFCTVVFIIITINNYSK